MRVREPNKFPNRAVVHQTNNPHTFCHPTMCKHHSRAFYPYGTSLDSVCRLPNSRLLLLPLCHFASNLHIYARPAIYMNQVRSTYSQTIGQHIHSHHSKNTYRSLLWPRPSTHLCICPCQPKLLLLSHAKDHAATGLHTLHHHYDIECLSHKLCHMPIILGTNRHSHA